MLGLFKGYRPKRIGSRFERIGFTFFIGGRFVTQFQQALQACILVKSRFAIQMLQNYYFAVNCLFISEI